MPKLLSRTVATVLLCGACIPAQQASRGAAARRAGCPFAPGGRVATAPLAALPETPAGRALSGWLAAYNTASRDTLAAFIARGYAPALLARRPAAERAAGLEGWLRDYGRMRVVRVDSSAAGAIVATVAEERVDAYGTLFVDVDSAPPRGITGVGLIPFVPPPGWEAVCAPEGDAELVADLERFAAALAADGTFAGTVRLARGGRPLLHRAYGTARGDSSTPNTLETRYELASVSKMFTAVAVAQLAERGRLRFSDPVLALLPDYPNRDAGARVTVHHLLTHSSGLPDFFRNGKYRALRGELRTLTDFWRTFAYDSLEFAPGERWDYSNSNFVLLGSIVERLSGEPFERYVERRVFRPAGMRSAAYAGGGPAGGGVAAAEDLGRFLEALLAGRLLSPETTEQVLTGRVAAEYGGRDGYGFETRVWNGVRIVGHGGAFPGVSNQADAFPEAGYTAVVLSNTDASGAQAIAHRVRVLLAARGRRAGPAGRAR